MNKQRLTWFLLLSFLEGGTVMGTELLGAKMLAPFFGSSLYVWSSVMAITLGGLAAGYYTGGVLSTRKNPERNLYVVLLFATVFTALMPFVSQFALFLFGTRSLIPAVIASSLMILFPPVFLMGTVSPLIVRNITVEEDKAGRAAGTVYAVSTLGGILATFLFGFYIIPVFGLTRPALFSGLLLGILPAVALIKKKDKTGIIVSGVLLWVIFSQLQFNKNAAQYIHSDIKVVYESEGLLGQILVLDFPNDVYYSDSTLAGTNTRWLFVNRISQTMENPAARAEKGEEENFTYVGLIDKAIDTFPVTRKKVLLLGLGGGSIAKTLSHHGCKVEVCELDKRITYVAKTYFELPESVTVYNDDARHFIRNCKNHYDVIIFDLFKGEETPSHVITTESLAEVKSLLNPGGMVFLNGFGFFEGKRGKGMRSLYKTFVESGFDTRVLPTEPDEMQRNLLFIASRQKLPHDERYFVVSTEQSDDAVVLTDDIPAFEHVNALAGLTWRRMAIQNYLQDRNQREIGLFK